MVEAVGVAATEGVSYARLPLCGWTDRHISTSKRSSDSGRSTSPVTTRVADTHREGTHADERTRKSFELDAVCDEEARRWQDYADRWGTDQYDEGPRTWTVDYVALAYAVASGSVRVWLVLLDLGLFD